MSDSGAGRAATINRALMGTCAVLTIAVLGLVAALAAVTGTSGPPAGGADLASGGIDDEKALGGFVANATAPQVSVVRLSDGARRGTASERYARPALSLSKLYIADYVLDHGDAQQKWEAVNMVGDSSDAAAEELYAAFPESVDATARKYGLLSTRSGKEWGYALTSSYDVSTFVAELVRKDPMNPILVAMARSAKIAEDGYEQDWGTARLPGMIGTKWGWSNDRDLHSSVSFSEDFVVAAAVTGDREELTDLVEDRLKVLGPWLDAGRTGSPDGSTTAKPTSSARKSTTPEHTAAATSTDPRPERRR